MTVKLVFVCSAARSGSTLLDMLLGRSARIESLGEINFLGKSIALGEACSCGVPVKLCAAWTAVFDAIRAERGIDLLRTPYALRQWDTRMDNANADSAQQTRAYLSARAVRKAWVYAHFTPLLHGIVPLPPTLLSGLNNAFYFYDLIGRLRHVDMVVDSSKEVHKAVAAYQRSPDTVRLIMLARDGRGVMYSRLYSGVRTSEAPARAIQQWQGYYARALWMLDRYVAREHVFHVRYESLTTEPERVLAELLAWLGIDVHGPLQSDKPLHIAGGNDGTKTRFNQGIKLDERWREGLNAAELALFERHAGMLNRMLGYA